MLQKSFDEFFGVPRTASLNLSSIKTAIDDLAALNYAHEEHVKSFVALRRNVIPNFFGNSPEIIIKLADINKSINEITTKIEAINVGIKTTNEIIKDNLPRMVQILEKVKIPADKENIINSVYTIKTRIVCMDTTKQQIRYNNISSSSTSGTYNTISTIIDKDTTEQFTLTTIDNSLAGASVTWYVEFVADLSKQSS